MTRRVKLGLAWLTGLAAVVVVLAAVWERPPEPFPLETPTGDRVDLYGDPLPPGAVARLGTVRHRLGATGGWGGLAFSADGSQLRGAFHERRVAWIDVETGVRTRLLRGHCDTIAASSDRGFDVEEAIRGNQRSWRDDTLVRILSLPGTEDFLTVGCTLRRWDAKTGGFQVLRTWDTAPFDAVLSPDGSTLAYHDPDNGVRVVDLGTGNDSLVVRDTVSGARFLQFTSDGDSLVLSGADGPAREPTGTALVVSVDGGVPLSLGGVDGHVFALRAGPDDTVWFAGRKGPIQVLSHTDGRLVREIAGPEGRSGRTIEFSDDGAVAAVVWSDWLSPPLLVLVDARTGAPTSETVLRGRAATRIAFSRDGSRVAVGSASGGVQVIDVADGRMLTPDTGPHGGLMSVACTPDGGTVATVSGEVDAVRVWDATTGEGRVLPLPDDFESSFLFGTSLRFVGGGATLRVLVRRGRDAPVVLDLDVATGRETGRHVLSPPEGWETGAATLGGERVAHQITPTRPAGGGTVARRPTMGSRTIVRDVRGDAALIDDEIQALAVMFALSDDGEGLLTARFGGRSSPMTLTRVPDDPAARGDGVELVAPGTNANTYAVARSGSAVAAVERTRGQRLNLLVYDGASGALTARREIPDRDIGRWQEGASLAFSPDGSLLVTGGSVRSVCRIWRVADGELLAEFGGHDGSIQAACFSADNSRLVTASADTTAIVWDVAELIAVPD